MDRTSVLLAALKTKSVLVGARIGNDAVEALAGVIGLPLEELPVLVSQLQRDGHVALVWGGSLDVLPERPAGGGAARAPAGGGPVFSFQDVTFGPGAVIAGRNATVTPAPEVTLGALAAVLDELRRLRPELSGEAAHAAGEAERAVAAAAEPTAAPEIRRSAAGVAVSALARLLDAAPKAKALVELGEKVLGAIS